MSLSTGRGARLLRNIGVLGVTGAALYTIDTHWNARTLQRNLRTAWNGVCIAWDYKVRFRPGADVNAIHQRTADRILHTCQRNGGLYVKFGQGVASMNHILPPQYAETLQSLFMEAPAMPYESVAAVIRQEFGGMEPDQVFQEFDREPVASASIAQVHRAVLHDGTPVAVKVQKDYIRQQLYWDMLVYRGILRMFEWMFELPLRWSADYTEQHMRQEVDFVREANNAMRARRDFASEAGLDVHVPDVYWQFTTERVMTSEWVDGIPLQQVKLLSAAGFSLPDVMRRIVDIFSHQIFISGFVHADPHPGNILIRWKPGQRKKTAEICLLDHGLYVEETDSFRHDYCLFWKSLFLMDSATMTEITRGWGIEDLAIFASATLQRPYSPGRATHLSLQEAPLTPEDLYRMQMVTKDRVRKFLSDTEKIPLELIFIGRNLNLIRSNNKSLGSPVNRVNIMAEWAVRGLGSDWRQWTPASRSVTSGKYGLVDRVLARWNMARFRLSLWVMSVAFYWTRLVQRLSTLVRGRRADGMEDILDRQVAVRMKETFGMELSQRTFDA